MMRMVYFALRVCLENARGAIGHVQCLIVGSANRIPNSVMRWQRSARNSRYMREDAMTVAGSELENKKKWLAGLMRMCRNEAKTEANSF